jgi:succinylglutamate desuccinylase
MLTDLIRQFENHEKKHPGIIPDSVFFDFGNHDGHISISSIIHGNEVGSLPAILKLIDHLITKKIRYEGKISFILGNKKASLENKRYLQDDLNRSFGKNLDYKNSIEKQRAFEIKKILDISDVFIDFHQTTMPCKEPFYIFAMHQESYLWARAIGNSKYFVTRKSNKPYSQEGMCSDEYMRSLNKPGITLELGEQGFHKNSEIVCYRAIKKALYVMDEIFLKKKSLNALAKKNQDFQFLSIKHNEMFANDKIKLVNGLFNLQKIEKNKIMGTLENGKYFYSPLEGYVLFPQYPKRNEKEFVIDPLPPYIYTLAIEIKKF